MGSSADILHIPPGIRFECSSCGNCCNGWPVPLTPTDVDRITNLHRELDDESSKQSANFRKLPGGNDKLKAFTHTLEKRDDGRCQFLTSAETCNLHLRFGPDSKPAMCRLFPYSFTKTPTGVYAYVSFASTGALTNHGKLLTQQEELLEEQFTVFESLFGALQTDWSTIQILDGYSLRWTEYLSIEKDLLSILNSDDGGSTLDRLAACSALVISRLPAGADPEKLPAFPARPKVVDQILLKHLHSAYLPSNVFQHSDFDVDTPALLSELVTPPPAVSFNGTRFGELMNVRLDDAAPELEDLLRRYTFSRTFGKFYFGPQFGHLSLVAGLHHWFFVISLIRLRAKLLVLRNGSISFFEYAEILRSLERRLTQMSFSKQTSAALEVLFSSPARLERVGQLAR